MVKDSNSSVLGLNYNLLEGLYILRSQIPARRESKLEVFCLTMFRFCFAAFSFATFSCLFPTGFISTFSTLAFLFALPIVLSRFTVKRLTNVEVVGLILFLWFTLSIFWSQASISKSLSFLSEYRIFLILPVFILALESDDDILKRYLLVALAGAGCALVASYLLGFGFVTIEGARYSLGNRIFHGFIMSILYWGCLVYARESFGIPRYVATVIAVLCAYSVINIEIGRTGYIQLLTMTAVFMIVSFRWKTGLSLLLSAVLILIVAYSGLDRFQSRVDKTIYNIEQYFQFDDPSSSSGERLELYKTGLSIGLENPVLGVGIGDVADKLSDLYEQGKLRIPEKTDNVHNEFVNILMIGGLTALAMFLWFLFVMVKQGLMQRRVVPWLGDSMIAIVALIVVSGLFNSIIKDYGEKHVLLIVISCLIALMKNAHSNGVFNESKYLKH